MTNDQAVKISIRRIAEAEDRNWMTTQMRVRWGSEIMVTRGVLHQVADQQGFVAQLDEAAAERVGWIIYNVVDAKCEIIVAHSLQREVGVGTALVNAVVAEAQAQECEAVWLITTNDNVEALHFWQKRGFSLAALHVNAMEKSRQLKPGIPLIGKHGIAIRDELEFRLLLGA